MTLARKSLSDMLPSTSSSADIAAAAAAASREVEETPPPAHQAQQRLAAVPYQAPEATKTASSDEEADDSQAKAVSAEVTTESSLADPAPAVVPQAKTFTRTKRASRATGQQAQRASEPAQPKYMTLARKEARLREDQVDNLSMLARKLSRAARGGEERITDNTLIRVAVDLLLAQSDKLAGSTEEELRKSLMK
ncbi:hypothetical protein AB0F43_31705 [Kribbella sp. NPDC023972]|uniref:hypothetical protein n=1 Tax=Kribbella sp. NPDC023972 TaxID=3154795 RepID=UPI0033CE6C62